MDDFAQEQMPGAPGVDPATKEKGKCSMCKFVLAFSFVAFLLVLVLIFLMKIPSATSVSF